MEDFTNAADYDGKAIFGLATATVTLDRLAKLAAHRGEVFIDALLRPKTCAECRYTSGARHGSLSCAISASCAPA
jgi:hypothetical protein